MWNILVTPFAWIMRTCYSLVQNYGVALIMYAILTKLILIPLTIKQQKTQMNMYRLRPYQNELMKKYGGNRQRYQEELMKLYQREGYSPTASCLPTFIQLPIIFLIYTIVRRPITYIADVKLSNLAGTMASYLTDPDKPKGGTILGDRAIECFSDFSKESGLGKVLSGIKDTNFDDFELQALPNMIENGFDKINVDFLGFDLSRTPSEFTKPGLWMLILIPIISGITSFLASWISQKLNPVDETQQQGGCSMKMMLYIMPLFSVWIAFKFTAALGIYWIASNVVAIAQTLILHRFFNPQKVIAEVEEKMRREKEAEKEKRRLAAEKRALSNNKNSKKKRAMNAQRQNSLNAQNAPALAEDTDVAGDTDTEKGE